jgi:hypothetical protein
VTHVEEQQRQQGLRVVTIGVMAVAALVGLLLVSGGPATTDARANYTVDRLTTFVDPAETTTTVALAAGATSTSGATPTTASGTTTPTTTPATDPGALPQTDEHPAASGATFTAGVDGLWEAIRQDKPELGLPFFFPQSAYLQVKAIGDPASDYQNRLIANFEQDVHDLHAQLGANAADAKLVGVTVPDDQAVLVQPGEESNKLSYWRVYGSTMQYEVDGQTGSFPVTSLISWRGQWYVVHLGTIR